MMQNLENSHDIRILKDRLFEEEKQYLILQQKKNTATSDLLAVKLETNDVLMQTSKIDNSAQDVLMIK